MKEIICKTGNIKIPLFKGSIVNSALEVNKLGYRVFTADEIMLLKVIAPNFDENFSNYLDSNYFDTQSTVAYNEMGQVKIVRNSKLFENLNLNNVSYNQEKSPILGVIGSATQDIHFDSYPNEIKGLELVFSKEDILKYANTIQCYALARRNPFLRALAHGNQEILDEYLYNYISKTKHDFPGIAISKNYTGPPIEKIITMASNSDVFPIEASFGHFNSDNSKLLCSLNGVILSKFKRGKKFSHLYE